MLEGHTEQEILAHLRQGNEDALLALHERHAGAVYAVAYRVLGEAMAAEEVTQDTFLRLWEKVHTYDPARGALVPWLLTIARRRAIDVLRQQQRQHAPAGETFSLDSHPSLYELVSDDDPHRDTRHSLAFTLAQLPPEQQTVIKLAYFYGMSHGDIAAYLDLPLGTVKTRLRLGMQKLRDVWLAKNKTASDPEIANQS